MKFFDAITDFIFVEDQPQSADAIFIPGGAYGEIAVRAAELYHLGYAPVLVPSGRYSVLEEYFKGPLSPWKYQEALFGTECEFFERILLDHEVPREKIWKENQATYTYENAIYTRKLLDEKGQKVSKAILCCQAFHARRCLLYYQLMFPDTKIYVCPQVTREISKENWYLNPEKIDLVLDEVSRCGSQFHDIMRAYTVID